MVPFGYWNDLVDLIGLSFDTLISFICDIMIYLTFFLSLVFFLCAKINFFPT